MTSFLGDTTRTDLTRGADLLQRARKALRGQRLAGHAESDRGALNAERSYERVETVLRRLASAMTPPNRAKEKADG